MTKTTAKQRIEKLKKLINRYSYRYHVLDDPEVDDAAWDSLKRELSQLERQYPEFVAPDSPTQRVSGKALDKFEKVTHRVRMLSLQDAFSSRELQDWETRIKKLVVNRKPDYFAELKVDGFAVSLIYRNGLFVRGSTRGDGRVGENVTQNLKTIPAIPLRLRLPNKAKVKRAVKEGEIEIRGEVYMTKQAFAKVNKEREKKGLSLYANPRNTAAGSIRQLDPKVAASRQLNFLAYELVTDLGQRTHQEKHQIVRALGFRTGAERYCVKLTNVLKFWKEIDKKRNKLPYQIDGIVVLVNNNRLFEKMGVVGKAPRGAIALKFPAEEVTTQVEDIVIQVGRTGALTPVAHLKPVHIGGTLVTRATLHNEDEIKRLNVRIGDTVVVQRAGDVIPDVVKVLKELRTGREKRFKMPRRCPVCGSRAVRPKGEAVHRCSSKRCGAQRRKLLTHFVSRTAFDIEGLGPKILDQLMDEGLVSSAVDLFSLTRGDLLPLERFAEKSAENLVKAIAAKKRIPLARFIYALGIRHVGEETAIALAHHFGSLAKLSRAGQEELRQVKDIGGVVAESVYQWFNDKGNQKFVRALLKSGLKIIKPRMVKRKLAGLTFVLTGELKRFTRDEAKAKIRELGGDISGSVSKQTDFVVVGKEPGSKYQRAKKLKIKLLNEQEFLKMI